MITFSVVHGTTAPLLSLPASFHSFSSLDRHYKNTPGRHNARTGASSYRRMSTTGVEFRSAILVSFRFRVIAP
jgi:hypothetical protein